MTPDQKKWIDTADFEALLRRWRFAPGGDPIFQGTAGAYYQTRMNKLRNDDPEGAILASKRIGWDR